MPTCASVAIHLENMAERRMTTATVGVSVTRSDIADRFGTTPFILLVSLIDAHVHIIELIRYY